MAKKRKPKYLTPIERMRHNGELDYCEYQAASDILYAYQLSLGIEKSGGGDMPAGSVNPGGADAAAAHRLDLIRKYSQWRSDLRGRRELSAAVGMIVEQKRPTTLEKEYQWGRGMAKSKAQLAIRHFAAICGNVPAWATERWKLT